MSDPKVLTDGLGHSVHMHATICASDLRLDCTTDCGKNDTGLIVSKQLS